MVPRGMTLSGWSAIPLRRFSLSTQLCIASIGQILNPLTTIPLSTFVISNNSNGLRPQAAASMGRPSRNQPWKISLLLLVLEKFFLRLNRFNLSTFLLMVSPVLRTGWRPLSPRPITRSVTVWSLKAVSCPLISSRCWRKTFKSFMQALNFLLNC